MKANELCPPPHLECADFPKETEVTIKTVSFAEVGEEKANKGVLHFEEFTRGLVLNRTNLKRIIEWHGNETDEWVGKKIKLYPSETEFGGKTVDCIRVKQKK
jgi:hypothetical protein